MKIEDIIQPLFDMWCRPSVEYVWDQWSEVRIECNHGTHYYTGNFTNIEEQMQKAVEVFFQWDHPGYCLNQIPVPQEWVEKGSWEAGKTSECDLWVDHEGPCKIYPEYEEEEKIRRRRRGWKK